MKALSRTPYRLGDMFKTVDSNIDLMLVDIDYGETEYPFLFHNMNTKRHCWYSPSGCSVDSSNWPWIKWDSVIKGCPQILLL